MCTCDPFYTWEMINATDVLFFKAPLLKQHVHKGLISNQSFDSLKECFDDVFWRGADVFADSSIGLYQFHNQKNCPLTKRRYTLESTDAFISLLEKNSDLLRNMCCHDSERIFNTFCQECLDRVFCRDFHFENVQNALLRSVMSVQSEWLTLHYTSADFYCNLDELWTGSMAYTIPAFQKNTCIKTVYKDYTMYSVDYD